MGFWLAVASEFVRDGRGLFLVAPAYVLTEVLIPKGQVSWRSRMQSGVFNIAQLCFTAPVAVAIGLAIRRLGVHPLIRLDLAGWLAPLGWLGVVLAVILSAVVYDFFFYWMHRAQHRFFWRFHSVHHSIEELSAVSCYHHASEVFFASVFQTIPMAFLVGVNAGDAPFLVAAIIANHTYWVHSSTQLNFGPLRRVFDDNRFHRIHHSKDPAHYDKNFGGFSTIWDQLFGTAYFPGPDEWPEVGLNDRPEPQSVVAYLWAPFVSRSRRQSFIRGSVDSGVTP